MDASIAGNRALQLRAMDELRKRLSAIGADVRSIPRLASLAGVDAPQLCDIGAGRLGVVAIVFLGPTRELDRVTHLVQSSVRRTDLLVSQGDDTLVVLAPGLDPAGGQRLTRRLQHVLSERACHPAAAGPALGGAYRSPLSLTGWDLAQLADEARHRALGAEHVETDG